MSCFLQPEDHFSTLTDAKPPTLQKNFKKSNAFPLKKKEASSQAETRLGKLQNKADFYSCVKKIK